jgi:hypothetical protein
MQPEMGSAYVIKYQLGHFKHAHPLFAVQHFLEFVVGLNEGFVGGVLQVVTANVIP